MNRRRTRREAVEQLSLFADLESLPKPENVEGK
jgi:hypothetical protein